MVSSGTGETYLVLAIVQDADAEDLMPDLMKAGHRATRMAATGGFLRRGSDVIVAGVETADLEPFLDVLRARCRTRRYRYQATAVPIPSEIARPAPSEVTVGGATVFVLPAARLEKPC